MPESTPPPRERFAGGRSSGKGKGRLGARKPFHAPRHGHHAATKPARRRRAKLHLRRG